MIDKKAFDCISAYLAEAKKSGSVLAGGGVDGDSGYFIQPMLVETNDPGHQLLCEEIFGPVVTAYVYDDDKWEEPLGVVDATSPHALTGAVFANERQTVCQAAAALRGPPATST